MAMFVVCAVWLVAELVTLARRGGVMSFADGAFQAGQLFGVVILVLFGRAMVDNVRR